MLRRRGQPDLHKFIDGRPVRLPGAEQASRRENCAVLAATVAHGGDIRAGRRWRPDFSAGGRAGRTALAGPVPGPGQPDDKVPVRAVMAPPWSSAHPSRRLTAVNASWRAASWSRGDPQHVHRRAWKAHHEAGLAPRDPTRITLVNTGVPERRGEATHHLCMATELLQHQRDLVLAAEVVPDVPHRQPAGTSDPWA